MKKYFMYTRVSSDDYDKSIDNQTDILGKLATDLNIDKNIIPYEEHKSGSRRGERVKFDEMMQLLNKDMKQAGKNINKREYGGILFFKIDRLARNDRDFDKLLRLLDAGYEFISATETIENTPTGRLLFRMLAGFSVYESEKLGNRQSLAKIHNLIKRKVGSVGGDTVIFGYTKLLKDDSVVVNEREASIIRKIHDIFVLYVGKKTYKEIFEIVDKEENGYLTDYFLKHGKTTSERFIGNILKNDNAMKYNGYVEIKINVNDELIKNYIDTIQDKEKDAFGLELEGYNDIGGAIKFTYYISELLILTDTMIEETKAILEERKKNVKNIDVLCNLNRGILDDILFYNYNGKDMVMNVYTGSKGYSSYRVTTSDGKIEKSEKHIENKILKSSIIKKIIAGITVNLSSIKELLSSLGVEKQKGEINKLKSTLNIYRGMKELYHEKSLKSKNSEDIERNHKLNKNYIKKEADTQARISAIEDGSLYEMDRYIEIMNIKSLKEQGYGTRARFYSAIFEKITYVPSEKTKDGFKIILKPFSFISTILGIDETISI